MTVRSVAALVDLIRESKLLPPAQLQLAATDIESEYTDAREAAEMLLRRKWLTPYQAEQLLSDKGQSLVLGPYILLEPIGEGGMGQVFKARHTLLDRIVALKIIRGERLTQDPEAVRRFQREARAAALLSHPHIILIYDMGVADDSNYFIAMEYVEGTDLGCWVKQTGPLPVEQACDFIRQAALGLQHAHEAGMVHRDIKPGNLFVTGLLTHPQTQAAKGITTIGAGPAVPGMRTPVRSPSMDRQRSRRTPVTLTPVVKILDMGLVRLTTEDGSKSASASLTQEGSIVGTPDYIAPEQARNAHRVDIRADLYSLGGTFYYLLTGQPPFKEGTAIEKLLMHQLDEPTPVARLRADVPADVAMIVHRLLAKFPKDRYQTPGELADVLAQRTPPAAPVRKKPETVIKPLNLSRIMPKPTGPDVVTEVLPANFTPAPAGVPAAVPSPASPPGLVVTPSFAEAEWRGIITPPPEQLMARPVETVPEPPSDRPEPARHIANLKGHSGCVTCLVFAPDRDTLTTGAVDGTVRVWDFRGKKPRERAALHKHVDAVNSLAFSPDNRTLASGSGAMDGLIWLWNMAEDQPREFTVLQGHQGPIDSLAFAPDGKVMASGGQDQTIRLWDVVDRQVKPRSVLKGHVRPVKALAFGPDSQVLVSAGQDYTVRVWEFSRMWSKERAVLQHPGEVYAVSFSPDGKSLAVACQDQMVHIWDLTATPKPREKALLKGHTGGVRQVQYLADGQTLAAAGEGRQVLMWDVETQTRLREWLLPKSLNQIFAFTVDGRYLANGTTDGPVNVFRVAEKRSHTGQARPAG